MDRVIHINRKYDMRPMQLPNGVWEVIDRETYDPEPGSEMHLHGHGDSIAEATTDLLEQLAELAAHPTHRNVEVGGSRFQPPEIKRERISDPVEEHNDTHELFNYE